MREDLIQWKARALLSQSPWSAVDPNGEPTRRAELEAWLTKVGIPTLNTPQTKRLDRAEADAHDAHVPPTIELPRVRNPILLHPLSAQPIADGSGQADHASFLASLRNLPAPEQDWALWYRQLWLTVVNASENLPADATLPDHSSASHRSMTAALFGARCASKDGQAALLYLHVGPVQGFISASRRTHDLWIASFTVAYLTFQAARYLAEELGPDAVVYPELSQQPLAKKLLFRQDVDGRSLVSASLANRVLAIVPAVGAEELAERAIEAVGRKWGRMGEAVLNGLLGDKPENAADTKRSDWIGFREQVESFVEADGVVQPWPDKNEDIRRLLEDARAPVPPWLNDPKPAPGAAYGVLFDLAHRTLTAHRQGNLPPSSVGDSRPKCTMCGDREQMGPIAPEDQRNKQQRISREFFVNLSRKLDAEKRSLQLGGGEGLCGVCLTKRLAPELVYGAKVGELGLCWSEEPDRTLLRFPSVSTVATAPLRELLTTRNTAVWTRLLGNVVRRLNFTPPGSLLPALETHSAEKDLLNHEGEWLYEMAYVAKQAWRSHHPNEPDDPEELAALEEPLRRAKEAFNEVRDGQTASAYYAVLVLDMDDLGDWLTGRNKRAPGLRDLNKQAPSMADAPAAYKAESERPLHPAVHSTLSYRLGKLAFLMRQVVDRHLGCVVYCGGDDLLAMLPLERVLDCVRELHATTQGPNCLGNRVTFSAGVAISHYHEPLSGALHLAREAQAAAKQGGKNALCIEVDKRSGSPLSITLPLSLSSSDRPSGTKPSAGDPLSRFQQLWRASKREGDESRLLRSTKALYMFDEECDTLGEETLREALQHRLRQALGFESHFLRDLLEYWDDQARGAGPSREARFRENAHKLRDLLLLARFFLRERLEDDGQARLDEDPEVTS
jgi:CRISPR-associated protein Cmr2